MTAAIVFWVTEACWVVDSACIVQKVTNDALYLLLDTVLIKLGAVIDVIGLVLS